MYSIYTGVQSVDFEKKSFEAWLILNELSHYWRDFNQGFDMKRWWSRGFAAKNQASKAREVGTFLIHKMHLNLESWILVSLLSSFLEAEAGWWYEAEAPGVVSQICALLRVENLAAVNFLGKKISTKQTGDSETNSTFHLICNLVHF